MGTRGQATYYADDGPRNKNDKGPILLFSLATVQTVDGGRKKKEEEIENVEMRNICRNR